MIQLDFKITDKLHKIPPAADDGNFRGFGHAAAKIRKTAFGLIRTGKQASSPGAPPRTRRRRLLKKSLRFDANKDGAVVGPRHSIVGESGAAHEFGESYKGQDYPERPFMSTAFEQNLNRIPDEWEGAIGE